jgi:3-oxoacyl-[acyl-carrier-protein] synthase I
LNKVYITAYSSVSALGIGNDESMRSLKDNRINIYKPSREEKFKLPFFRVDGISSDKNIRTKCAEITLKLLAQIEDRWTGFGSMPVYVATSTGGIKETEEIYTELVKSGKKYPLSEKAFFYDIYDVIKQKYGDKIGRTVSTFTSACSSAGHGLLHAFRLIRSGSLERALVIGVDALSLTTLIGFDALKLISPTGTKPLTAARDGLSIGEGGGIVLLESEPSSKPFAEIMAIHSNTDGYHLTSPNTAGTQQAECIMEVIGQSGLKRTDVDYINAHGTGTPLNDEIEMKVIKSIFDEVSVSSLKGFTGHTLGSSALTELCLIMEMLKSGRIHVPENLGVPMDEKFIPSGTFEKKIRYFIKNSFGFGGNNVCILARNMMLEDLV